MPESCAHKESRISMRIITVILAVITCPLGAGFLWADDSSEHAE